GAVGAAPRGHGCSMDGGSGRGPGPVRAGQAHRPRPGMRALRGPGGAGKSPCTPNWGWCNMRLADRTALVTGSTRGIGLAIARRLAAAGAAVAVTGRSEEQVQAVVAGLEADGAKAAGFAADLTDGRQAEA